MAKKLSVIVAKKGKTLAEVFAADPIPKASAERDPTGRDQHAPGAKVDAGKQLAGVLMDFSRALTAVAEVGSRGARKYTRGGWQQVPNGVQRYTDAFWRHLLAVGRGELIDPDLGVTHWSQVCWNCLALIELTLREAEGKKDA